MATIAPLDRIEGPPCPTCGCRHSAVQRVMGTSEVRRCRYCHKEYRHTPDPDPVVVYSSVRVICPICGQKNAPVYSLRHKGQLTVRYHQCGSHQFASEEVARP